MPPHRLDGMPLLALAMRGSPCRSTAFRLLRFRGVTGRGDRSGPAPLLRGARRGGGFGRHGRHGCGCGCGCGCGDDYKNGRGSDEGRKLQADPPERPRGNRRAAPRIACRAVERHPSIKPCLMESSGRSKATARSARHRSRGRRRGGAGAEHPLDGAHEILDPERLAQERAVAVGVLLRRVGVA